MATLKKAKPLAPSSLHDASKNTISIIVAQWNSAITHALLRDAVKTLQKAGIKPANLMVDFVPGSFELPLAAQWQAANKKVDAVICLGCVVQGETRHFDFICDAVAHGIMKLNLKFDKPVIFGVLTTNTIAQAKERAGGKHGNKGQDAAEATLDMLKLKAALS